MTPCLPLQRTASEPVKRPMGGQGDGEDSDEEPPDEVRLWEDGWKERYYQSKFGVEAEDMQEFRVQVRLFSSFSHFPPSAFALYINDECWG